MPDLSAIAGLMTSLKATGDILKSMIGLRDAEALRRNTYELQAEILKATSFGISAYTAQLALTDRVRELEDQIRQHDDWEREKERYVLVPLYDGALAYQLKSSMEAGQAPQYICPHCYEEGVKSRMQGATLQFGGHKVTCHRCKLELQHSWRDT